MEKLNFIPVFNVTWYFRKSFQFGAQETFLIINVENRCAFQSFFCGNIYLQISLNSSKDSIYLNSLKQKTVLYLLNIKYTSKNLWWYMHFLQKVFNSTFMGSKLKPQIISIHAPPSYYCSVYSCLGCTGSNYNLYCLIVSTAFVLVMRSFTEHALVLWQSDRFHGENGTGGKMCVCVCVCVCWMAVTWHKCGGFLKLASSTSV